jgi:lambda repressor-like predicted transcriptional regulator
MLIGVSRAYKESSNCRMEAQYGLQKKKPLIPLMLTQGYEADGWLGLMLGTSMWYAFYGETLSSASAFEGRMESLAREIGGRGRADAQVAEVDAADAREYMKTEATLHDSLAPEHSVAAAELQSLRLKELRARATAHGVDSDTLEDMLETDDPKAAMVELLLNLQAKASGGGSARLELEGLRLKELRSRAKQAGYSVELLEDVLDNDDPKAAVIELLLSSSAPSLIASPPEVCADASNGASELQAMMMMRKVKKRAFEPFIYKGHLFTKTGSGQT